MKMFHGPGARDRAMAEAAKYGSLLHPPFGEGGLKRDEVTELIEIASVPVAGGRSQGLVVGPLDRVRDGNLDALLKTLEEPPVATNHLILYAEDAYAVSATIRSRVEIIFCPRNGDQELDTVDFGTLMSAQGFWKLAAEYKGKEQEWIRAIVNGLDPSNPVHLRLYLRLRPLTTMAITTPTMILSALWETSDSLRERTSP